ncbi:carboxypeptidase M32 [Portibacter lacus]|uniref:Metal-dependent carboxypeptidase n=1 Tax=Portibacter lacus TaxID=1099794 RepID=A0AA37SJE7_9BACT|nr:carboxypeptidase M32 [Portibacter lacus]GLR15908.1 carboxypeptidase M32 [Portibacter lacus]
MSKYEEYEKKMKKLADIGHSIAVLSWDKEVNLPKKGAAYRGQQIATLSGISHELFTDESFGKLLNELSSDPTLDQKAAKNIKVTLKDYKQSTRFDEEFVIRKSNLVSAAYHAWLKAREDNDFASYEEALSNLVAIKREEAEILGYEDHPYDALLDLYEPGLKVKDLDVLFKDVREQLVPFIREISKKNQVQNDFLHLYYNKDKQWDFGIDLLKNMGYDFDSGRQDIAPHPFTITFSAQDVRVTTRIDENDFANMCWSCIHEGGHALYEQGVSAEDYGLPTGSAISLGIHESQSRLWENHVGRSKEYWEFHYPKLQELFPENLSAVSLDEFYKGINRVEPNFIRTEADELHYHFHVMVRYELEKLLISGDLEVKDLKETWNAKYKEYLNVDIPDDLQGILQDVHWGHGSFGYFPTYSLGSFYAAQFFAEAVNQIPNLMTKLSKGDSTELLSWLRTHIHQHGRLYEAAELCERVTGEQLNFKYFMEYARKKYKEIYKFA